MLASPPTSFRHQKISRNDATAPRLTCLPILKADVGVPANIFSSRIILQSSYKVVRTRTISQFYRSKMMRQIKKHIAWFLISWIGGLVTLFIVATLFAKNPEDKLSMQDLFGFGGLLLIGCLVLISFSYLPLMWLFKRMNFPSVGLLRSLVLVSIGNIPIYLLLALQYQGRMNIPEALVFLSGYIAFAIIYGIIFRHKGMVAFRSSKIII